MGTVALTAAKNSGICYRGGKVPRIYSPMKTTTMTMASMTVAAANSQHPSWGRRLALNAAVGDRFMSGMLSIYLSPVSSPRKSNGEKEEEDENVEKEDFTVHLLQGYVKLIVLLILFSKKLIVLRGADFEDELREITTFEMYKIHT